ncbi:MAG: type IV secretion system DNA-binding domain-containing protein [Pseudomonadota bacterium]
MTKVRTSYGDGITRGGQLFLNRLKNANELILAAWKGMAAILVVGTLAFAFWQAPVYERYLLQRWAVSAFWANVSSNANKPIEIKLEAKDGSVSNQISYVSADVFPQSKRAKKMLWGYVYRMIVGAIIMGLLNMGFLAYLIWQSKRDNDDAMDDQHLRGTPLSGEQKVKRALKLTSPPGRIKVGPYSVPQSFETGHFLFLGGHGCGKSNAINRMCTGIRAGGQRAIVYDVAGTYIEKFYRPGKDVILNPLDERGAAWTIWADVRLDAEYDYERIVQSLVPADDPKSSFWYKGAQSLLKGVAKKLHADGNATNKALYDMLAKMDLEELCQYCVGTEAGGVVSPESERVSADIRGTLLTAFTGFKYLRDAAPGSALFSIREWMQKGSDDSWLFISSKEDQADTLKGLITMWVDLICANILSLTPCQNRRMWMVFDEVHTLGRLPSLENAQNMSRKYGGCIVLGTQSVEQLAAIYGMDLAKSILGACHTRAFFHCNPDTAKWGEKNFGQIERIEASENLSWGPHEFRDGAGLTKKREMRTNVLASEIADLPPLHFFLRFGRGVPNAFVEDKYLSLKSVEPGFVDRKIYVEGVPNTPPENSVSAASHSDAFAPSDHQTSPSAPQAVRGSSAASTLSGNGMLGPLRPVQRAERDAPVSHALSGFLGGDDDLAALADCDPDLKARWQASRGARSEADRDDARSSDDAPSQAKTMGAAEAVCGASRDVHADHSETALSDQAQGDVQMHLPFKTRPAGTPRGTAGDKRAIEQPQLDLRAEESEGSSAERHCDSPQFKVKRGRPKKQDGETKTAADS